MNLEKVKRNLEKGININEDVKSIIEAMPLGVFEQFIVHGLSVDLIEPGHLICSMEVPPRLLNSGNSMNGAATASLIGAVGTAAMYTLAAEKTALSLEFNISYLGAAYLYEELEIEARTLHVDKDIGVINVDLRKKKTGKLVAQGRYTNYLAVASKL
ncbi:Thioesterase superfamily protein [Euphorbia peplus]|nr:Thioesterase superfamily protein [Euphorbia peplus]